MENFKKLTMYDENIKTTTSTGSVIKPPLGLIPKRLYDERVTTERFNQVCEAISRYCNAGMKINIEWIEEYNDLVEKIGEHYH